MNKLTIEKVTDLFDIYIDDKYHEALKVIAYHMIGNAKDDILTPILIPGEMTKNECRVYFKKLHSRTKTSFSHLVKNNAKNVYEELLRANILAYRLILKTFKN